MKDFQLSTHNINELFNELSKELETNPLLIVATLKAGTGKWGMAKLWRSWMSNTAVFMKKNGVSMPLYIRSNGKSCGKRSFSKSDAHELFTSMWLGVDVDGIRLSWAKKSHDGMRAATKGERFNAMMKHEQWALEKGIMLFKPRDSEYSNLEAEQNN